MALVVRNGGATFTLPLGPTCTWRSEEMPPGEAQACPECACPITPGREHGPCDPQLCVLGWDDEEFEL